MNPTKTQGTEPAPVESTPQKPLVVYFSNKASLIGEIAHKLALQLHGDIYEIKTPKLVKRRKLVFDGRRGISKVPIVFDILDFSPYNPIYIGGETLGKHVIGPVRSWMTQNKGNLLDKKKQLNFFVVGKHPKTSLKNMREILGEPYRVLEINPKDYPLDMQRVVTANDFNEKNETNTLGQHEPQGLKGKFNKLLS